MSELRAHKPPGLFSCLATQGTLDVRGNGANVTESLETVAAKTAALNTPQFLHDTFLSKENDEEGRILEHIQTADGVIVLYWPTGPYSDGSVMILAGRDVDPLVTTIPTEPIYAFSKETQKLYWELFIKTLDTLRECVDPHTYLVFLTENCVDQYSNETYRTSRTLGSPHGQVVPLKRSAVDQSKYTEVEHLRDERQLLSSQSFREVSEAISKKLETPFYYPDENGYPMGYSFYLPEDFTQITEVLATHHKAYAEEITKNLDELTRDFVYTVIPQPSYRLYIHRENSTGKLLCTIAPEIISSAGVMETLGINHYRRLDAPSHLSSEEEMKIRTCIQQMVQRSRN